MSRLRLELRQGKLSQLGRIGCPIALAAWLVFLGACRTPPSAPVDLTQPAWTVRQGQAVWTVLKSKGEAEGVAGELLVATQSNGACWLQFSKPPFSLVTAQSSPPWWHIAFQQGRKRTSGRGTPPARLIWFQLARALQGESLAAPWEFVRASDDSWRLRNAATGEGLEGYLAP